ncbi:MAG: trypsin-like peptidase domain-containing protein [Acidobacteria bacterium]|jgi:hypothetical protein|nr:trypsin-like peptidase domain-containing protein [Acidobacteriota bacterium]
MTRSNRARPLVVSLAMLLAALAALPALAQAPERIGEYEPLSISTPHPYPSYGAGPIEQEVRFPGATYVRLHFSRFALNDGDWVELTSPDGAQVWRYAGKGPHGTGEFWANTILGEAAIVRFFAPQGGGYGFDIDGAGRGTKPLDGSGPSPDSVCGTQDWKDAKCYQGGAYDAEYQKGRGAVLALIGCCSSCTAFKVSDGGQFMTNNHCTSDTSGVQSTELRLEYQTPGCASGSPSYTAAVMGSQLLKTDYTLDYTLFTTTGDASSIPCLALDPRLPPVGERIYIAGHPNGGPKKLSIESDQNSGGLCKVDASPYSGRDATSDIGYYCDTIGGSSGSPVLSATNHKVVGLHHYGGCLNSGVRVDRIYPQISSLLGSCEGGGGGGGETCGNGTCGVGENKCKCPADCGTPPATETGKCKDGLNNDCDGARDCADSDCTTDPLCQTCKPTGAFCSVNADCCSKNCKNYGSFRACR